MKRISAVVASALLANVLIFTAPARAYYPDPGELLFIFVTQGMLATMDLVYDTSGPSNSPGAAGEPTPEEDCATGAPVKIERKKKTGWVKVVKGKTNKKAKFREKIEAKAGKYRAHILAYTTPDGNSCFEGYGDPTKVKT